MNLQRGVSQLWTATKEPSAVSPAVEPDFGRAPAARGAGSGDIPERSEGGDALQVEIGEVVLGPVGAG